MLLAPDPNDLLDSGIFPVSSLAFLPAEVGLFFQKPEGQPESTDAITSQLKTYNLFVFKSIDEDLDVDAFLS